MSDSVRAYRVTDRDGISEHCEVVFAETAGKAKALALCTDTFEDFQFTEISVRRRPELDQYYRGEWSMDWENPADRIAMVRFGNFSCHPEERDYEECRSCSAREWCNGYESMIEEQKEDEEWLKK